MKHISTRAPSLGNGEENNHQEMTGARTTTVGELLGQTLHGASSTQTDSGPPLETTQEPWERAVPGNTF